MEPISIAAVASFIGLVLAWLALPNSVSPDEPRQAD